MKAALAIAALAVAGCASAEMSYQELNQVEARSRADCSAKGYPAGDSLEACVIGDVLAATGRLNQAPLDARLTYLYGARCRLAGFPPGTGAFGQCLLYYADQTDAAQRAALLNLARSMRTQPIINVLPQRTQTMCTSILSGQLVTTSCW